MFKKFLNNVLYKALVLSFVAIGLGLFYITLVKFGLFNFYILCSFSSLLCFVAAIFTQEFGTGKLTDPCYSTLMHLSVLFVVVITIKIPHDIFF